MRRLRNLMPLITSETNLQAALRQTTRGKRQSRGFLEWREYGQANLARLREELCDGGYAPSPFHHFTVFEPKPRLISAVEFKDRVVHHALMNVIGPPFDRALLPYTFACRVGLGTHAGARHIQALLRKTGATHYLQTDFRQYFASIARAILHELFAAKIACHWALDLLARIVPVSGHGLPIGALTSQHSANLYAGDLDRFIHDELRPLGWARYMDDIVLLGTDPATLREHQARLAARAWETRELTLSRWRVAPLSAGIDFLGYRLWPTHKLLRKRSVTRAKRTIAHCLAHGEPDRLARFLPSWLGHARWADAHHLLTWLETRHALVLTAR